MRRGLILLALTAALAGCGGDDGKAAPSPTPSPTPSPAAAPGPATFLEQARQSSLGSADLASADDSQLLGLGNTVCDGVGEFSFSRAVEVLVGNEKKPTTTEAEAFVRLAVTNLCPEHSAKVP